MRSNPLSMDYLNQKSNCKSRLKSTAQTNKPKVMKHQALQQISQFSLAVKIIKTIFPIEGTISSNMIYTNEGYLFSFLKKQNAIIDRSCIIFPQAIIANCKIQNGKLNGWSAICKKDLFYNLYHFKNGILQGQQYSYDMQCQLMVKSNYRNQKVQSINQTYVGGIQGFLQSLKSKELINLLNDTINGYFFNSYFPKLQSSTYSYYGEVREKIPSGAGILITDKQLFYGQFNRGLLNGLGTISFQNGQSYVGDLKDGILKGNGMYINKFNECYKYYETLISKEQFIKRRGIAKYQQIPEISIVFKPVINIFKQLRVIYQRQKAIDQSLKISSSEIEIDKNEKLLHRKEERQQQEENEKQLSNNYHPHQRQYLIDNSPELFLQRQQIPDYKDKDRNNLDNFPIKRENPKNASQKKKTLKFTSYEDNLRQLDDDNNNYQQQIVDKLSGQDLINKQSAPFISNKNIELESIDVLAKLKKDHLNSRINIKDSIRSQFRSKQEKQQLQNRMIKRIVQQK